MFWAEIVQFFVRLLSSFPIILDSVESQLFAHKCVLCLRTKKQKQQGAKCFYFFFNFPVTSLHSIPKFMYVGRASSHNTHAPAPSPPHSFLKKNQQCLSRAVRRVASNVYTFFCFYRFFCSIFNSTTFEFVVFHSFCFSSLSLSFIFLVLFHEQTRRAYLHKLYREVEKRQKNKFHRETRTRKRPSKNRIDAHSHVQNKISTSALCCYSFSLCACFAYFQMNRPVSYYYCMC